MLSHFCVFKDLDENSFFIRFLERNKINEKFINQLINFLSKFKQSLNHHSSLNDLFFY
jgi:hypothetical protein